MQQSIGVPALALLPKPRLRGTSHFYALFVAVVAALVLVVTAPGGLATFAASVYAVTLVGMFGASALYHRGNWSPPTARRLLQLDHTAIFLLIAGTYTPIALLAMHGCRTGRHALRGVAGRGGRNRLRVDAGARTARLRHRPSTCASAGSARSPSSRSTRRPVGGASGSSPAAACCYTIGAIVHAARRPDPWPETFGYHEIFHVFVILAALMHYCAIAFLVLPLD